MTDPTTDQTEPENETAPLPPDAAPTDETAEEVTTTASSSSTLSAERVLDMMLGAAVVAAETARRTAIHLRDNAPNVIAEWEEKGRPLREQLLGKLGSAASTTASGFSEAGTALSAEEEISTLEQRVRELEQQLASGGVTGEDQPSEDLPTSAAAENSASAGSPPEVNSVMQAAPLVSTDTEPEQNKDDSEETNAEDATYVYGEEPAPDSLADSEYAISETAEEAQREEDEPNADETKEKGPQGGSSE